MIHKTTMSLKTTLPVLVLIVLAVFFWAVVSESAHANSNGGIPVVMATSSNPSLGTTAVLLFATSTCQSRIITTYANPVMLTFGDGPGTGTGPTAIFGHLQAASTTVVYNADTYGCGAYRAYQFGTAAITISEFR